MTHEQLLQVLLLHWSEVKTLQQYLQTVDDSELSLQLFDELSTRLNKRIALQGFDDMEL